MWVYMKNTDMLYWVGTMNSIKAQAEEIIFSELIYVWRLLKANELKIFIHLYKNKRKVGNDIKPFPTLNHGYSGKYNLCLIRLPFSS